MRKRIFVGALCALGAALALANRGSSVSAQQSGCDSMTGGGFIITTANNTHGVAKATLAIAGGCKKGLPTWGHLEYQDQGNGLNAHWSSITAYNLEGTDGVDPQTGQPTGTRLICGTARTNLYGNVDFAVRARDRGEPGTSDEFDIRLKKFVSGVYTTVYATTATLTGSRLGGGQTGGGNDQLHKPNPSTSGSFGGSCPAGAGGSGQPGPDVMVSKSTDTPWVNFECDPVSGVCQIRYQLVVDNAASGSTATNVTVTDDLPTGASGTLSWTIASISPAPVSPDGCMIPDGHTLTCNFSSLASGTANDITINVRAAPTQCGQLDNFATVSAQNEALAQQNNNNSGTVTILECQE